MRKTLAVSALLLLAGCNGHSDLDDSATQQTTETPVIVLAASAADTIEGRGMVPIGPELTDAGFKVLSLDLPCHGADGSGGIACWRERIDAGDLTIFRAFCDRLSTLLTAQHIDRIAVVGISRGGYVALKCASMDSRIAAVGLIAPVTNLMRLDEFKGAVLDEQEFSLWPYRAQLRLTPMLLRMTTIDPRVGTDSALAFLDGFQSVTRELVEGTGHGAPENGETAAWLKSLQ